MRGTVKYLLGALVAFGCSEPARTFRNPGDGGATGDGPCAPGMVYCEGSSVAFRCDTKGQVSVRTTCEAPAGTCVPGIGCRVCRPDSTRCDPTRSNRPQRCRMDGGGWDDGTECDAAAGQSCNAGMCQDRCNDAAIGRSYLGCSYWPTITANSALDPMFRFAVVLSNPQGYNVRATITGGALPAPRVVDLMPGAIETVELPWVNDLVQLNANCPRDITGRCIGSTPARSVIARNGAYHVQTNGPIVAYQFNPLTFSVNDRFFSYTNDASLLLPQNVLTRRYTVAAWPDLDNPTGAASYSGFVSVVGVTGETTEVTVRANGRVRAGTGVTALGVGQTQTYTLQAGDVLQLVGDGRGDLTGTTIESSLPVAVFVGHDCAQVPTGRVACDHLEEQLLPDETWGRDYVVSALRDRGATTQYVVRVMSRADDNEITFTPEDVHAPVVLRRGEVAEVQSTRHFRARGTGPFLVTQFMIGQGPATTGGTGAGDPAMVLEVPVQQYRDRYDFYVPDTYPSNFFNVVAPTGSALTLDDMPLRGSSEMLGEFTIYTLPIAAGAHRLRSGAGQGIGLKVYGIARYTSYMYPGGLDLQIITPG